MKKTKSFTQIFANSPVVCAIVSVLIWSLFSAFDMWHGSKEFFYIDTDCYTRYLRITDWLSDFSWFEKIFPFTNCPDGEVLHFTRINDIIWLIFSLPFWLFMPLKEAVFAGGLIFSPVMFALCFALIMSGLKNYIGKKDFAKPALFIFIFGFIFLNKTMMFDFGRPDHHSLMLVIASFLTVNLFKPNSTGMFFAGFAAAMGIWASSALEGMLLTYVVLLILCLGWIFYKQPLEYAYRYTLGLFSGTLLAYALNPPYEGYLYFDNARLSLLHVAACGFTFASFGFLKLLNPKTAAKRIVFLGLSALVSLILLFVIFGVESILMPVYDEKISGYFVPYISEMKPAFAWETWYFIFGSIEAFVLYRFFKRCAFSDIALYILFFAYLPFSVLIRRFLPYGILFYVFLNALFLAELFKRLPMDEKYKSITLGYIVLNLFCTISFSYAVIPVNTSYPQLNGCALTDIFFAPQIIYKTGITTIGSPYHRNVEGIADTVEIFSGTDEKQIKKALKNRKVKYVIISTEIPSYLENAPEDSLYKSLLEGKEYDWLHQIGAKDGSYRFYEIKHSNH